ncbi:hypothetical protein [Microbacterium plantarum]|uniref:hypothetical protein n=1 Tax=Microbacterium plantarum TaxID=1816425 RepID=UPI002B49CB58|nr:hypothetical protein [Microbacterium plantarum]WRK16928.1 hypothetical protein VC184_13605 [Microbacterium plantarum]
MYGAVGDASDSTEVSATMLEEAKNARRSGTPSSMSDGAGTYVIELPAGNFTIKQLNGLLASKLPQGRRSS